jgi:hypothetical protein
MTDTTHLAEELIQTAAVVVAWLEKLGYTQNAALTDIRHERFAQDEKWGNQAHKPNGTWLAILGEEYGEVAKELLEGGHI